MQERKLQSTGRSADKVTVLMSSSVLPAVFQTWSEGTAQLFKSRNLFKFLTGETPSKFDEPKPRFRWQLENEIEAGIKTDPGGGAKKDLQRDFQGVAAQADDTPAAATLGGSPLITEIGVFASPEAETQGKHHCYQILHTHLRAAGPPGTSERAA
ncbi:hypothetical protein B484DRAFT_460440 [Ochromonadaceae sp. CCMP2298]|nr:hypothetical protein B484DRAFT_460440 [Ochromonadaceae sp. CCMP2298]